MAKRCPPQVRMPALYVLSHKTYVQLCVVTAFSESGYFTLLNSRMTAGPTVPVWRDTVPGIVMDNAASQGQSQRKLRILCLHGWRTSGKILSMQTAAMQYHTPLEYHFVTAPHSAEGPPDSGISIYYPRHSYFEWYVKSMSKDGYYAGLDESINLVLSTLSRDGPFDGILGFSQGAAMATRLAQLQDSTGQKLFSLLILIGGVPPLDVPKVCKRIDVGCISCRF